MTNELHIRRTFLTCVLSLSLAACAPDAWRPDSPYEAFLNQVQNKCWNLDLGGREINSLLNDSGDAATGAYFLDLTSRYPRTHRASAAFSSRCRWQPRHPR